MGAVVLIPDSLAGRGVRIAVARQGAAVGGAKTAKAILAKVFALAREQDHQPLEACGSSDLEVNRPAFRTHVGLQNFHCKLSHDSPQSF
jgi:hypothetical protein